MYLVGTLQLTDIRAPLFLPSILTLANVDGGLEVITSWWIAKTEPTL